MKTIGLIGGMSWESSTQYYRLINIGIKTRLGSLYSGKIILFSVNFADIEALQHQGRWADAGDILIEAAQKLEMAGADMVLLCTNTMHKLADDIANRISIPFLHIGDAVALAVCARGLRRVGLLGTRFTMEEPFYRQRLEDGHGLAVLLPTSDQRDTVHRIIYDELCQGIITPQSRQAYEAIIHSLVAAGAEGIILGCTEIELLMADSTIERDTGVPLFPTTQIHAAAAVELALAGGATGAG